MHELDYLRDMVIILGLGVPIVAFFHKFKIPTIAGFIVAGMIVGPKGLGFVNDMHQVEMLAEIGVTLLLFGIGLELPLDRLRRIWKPVVIGGSIQVGLTIGLSFFIASFIGMTWQASLLTGFIVAVSSTAIVLKGLEQRGEIDAPHGRLALGILIFQDLCVVPMIMIIPLLTTSGGEPANLFFTLAESVVIIAVVILAARLVVPKLMDIVAQTRQRHLFIMTILLVCIGTAWVSAITGVSLALGAFLAGLIVAGGGYRHQALADIFSFREVFISIFFVSVGMLLDLTSIIPNIVDIIMLLVGIMVIKFLIVFIAGLAIRMPVRVSAMGGTALAQVGEFSFVMMGVAATYHIIDPMYANNLMTVAVFSMLLTPFALSFAPTLAAGVGKFKALTELMDITSAEEVSKQSTQMKNHIIIGGYGLAGHDLAKALKASQEPHVIVDINPENVSMGLKRGEPITYGDITSPEVLTYLGATKAKAFVIVVNDHTAVEQAVKAARSINQNLFILVRTRYLQDFNRLTEAGADEVIIGEVATANLVVTTIMGMQKV